MIVSGHMLEKMDSATWILTSIDTSLDKSPKFLKVFGKNPTQLLTNYYNSLDKPDEELKKATDKLRDINNNKLLILPFKPGMQCSISVKMETVTVNKDVVIKSIQWTTDKETYKLKCTINFEASSQYGGSKIFKLPITEYTKSFTLKSISLRTSASSTEQNLLEITDAGIFKPIEITDGSSGIAIDGSFLYHTVNGETSVIGYWSGDELVVVSKSSNSKAYKKLMKSIDIITAHRRYIGPYNIYPCNTITIK